MNGLPSEILSQIVELVPTRARLIALRGCSRSFRQAVHRAASTHDSLRTVHLRASEAQSRAADGGPCDPRQSGRALEALARVFGAGCRDLWAMGESAAALAAIRSFIVTGTQGRLRCLVFHKSTITPTQLVDLCRACPLLTDLSAAGCGLPNLYEPDISIDEYAAEIGAACPLLERVNLPDEGYDDAFCPAEVYQMHFPNLRYLDLGYSCSSPGRYDRIAMSARACRRAASHLQLSCNVQEDVVEQLAAIPELRDGTTHINMDSASIPPECVILVAQRFLALRQLRLPDSQIGMLLPDWESLYVARPELTGLQFGHFSEIDDDCLYAVCHSFRLETLGLAPSAGLTVGAMYYDAVDIIVNSPCAATLRKISVYDLLSSADLLRLLRGCPNISEVCWDFGGGRDPFFRRQRDLANLHTLLRILQSRGGKLDSGYLFRHVRPREYPGVLVRDQAYYGDKFW